MDVNKIFKTLTWFSIIGSVGLLLWWFLMPVLLPVSDSQENFQNIVLHQNWIPLNILGLAATLLLTIGFPAFYFKYHKNYNNAGFVGLILTITGLILFTGIQYYETFLWPAAAKVNPDLLKVEGALVSGDFWVIAGLIGSGATLGIGYIVFGISSLKANAFPKIPVWLILIGAPVFGNGIAFPIRTIGLVLLCVGTIWMARQIQRDL